MAKNKKKSSFKQKELLFVSYVFQTKDGRVNWCTEQFINTKTATTHFNNNWQTEGAKLLGFKPSTETVFSNN